MRNGDTSPGGKTLVWQQDKNFLRARPFFSIFHAVAVISFYSLADQDPSYLVGAAGFLISFLMGVGIYYWRDLEIKISDGRLYVRKYGTEVMSRDLSDFGSYEIRMDSVSALIFVPFWYRLEFVEKLETHTARWKRQQSHPYISLTGIRLTSDFSDVLAENNVYEH